MNDKESKIEEKRLYFLSFPMLDPKKTLEKLEAMSKRKKQYFVS